jgi:hypothetical protein
MAGVFGLKKAYNRQRVDNWPESSNYGYYTGGTYPSATYKSDIQRIDFFNETVSVPGNLPGSRKNAGGVFNSNYGYLGAGQNPQGRLATIARIDFSNETTSDVSNNLPQERAALTAVSSLDYGYFGGGTKPPLNPPWQATIDRIDFSNETTSAPGNNLTEERANLAGVFTSDSGYFAGGNPPPVHVQTSIIDRIDFTSETVVGPPIHGINLTQTRQSLKGVSSSNYGYFAGGYDGETTPATVATIDRIDFSTEVLSTPGNNLPEQRSNACGVFNLNYGYFAGGQESPPTLYSALVSRIDFSTEVLSTPGNNLPQGRSMQQTVSGGKRINARGGGKQRGSAHGKKLTQYGYFGGGFDSPPTVFFTSIERIDVSNETVVELTNSHFTLGRNGSTGLSSPQYGYFCGGSLPPGITKKSNVTRIDFSNEVTRENTSLEVPYIISNAGYFDTPNYGYLVGGSTPDGYPTYINKLDYSTESFSSGGTLNLGRGYTASFTTPNYGFVCGGFYQPGNTRTDDIDRFDLSTETSSNVPYSLPTVRRGQTGLSSNEYGYSIGGSNPGATYSNIVRIDYNADTVSNQGNFKYIQDGSSFNSLNYGYTGGGTESGSYTAKIFRLDYNTDTGNYTSTISLNQERSGPASVSN